MIEWHWGPQQIRAFKELKTCMCCSVVLIQPNFNKQFFLQADASAYGVDIVLSQEGEHLTHTLAKRQKPILHPIAYFSCTFTSTECNYDIYERELLAVMKSLVHWRPYLGWIGPKKHSPSSPIILISNTGNPRRISTGAQQDGMLIYRNMITKYNMSQGGLIFPQTPYHDHLEQTREKMTIKESR